MSVPLWSALLWSDWDFNQINNDSDGDEDGVQDSQDSDPRNASLSRDWNCDGDGMPDVWEYRYQLALRSSSDAGQAEQLYTIANLPPLESYEDFVAAWTADVNNVGMTPEDAYAQMQQTRQDVLASWLLIDPYGDGLGNLREFRLGTHPHIADTDGDGINDLAEMQGGSDPTDIVSVPPPASSGTGTQAGGSTDSSGTSNSGSGSGGSPSPPESDPEEPVMQYRSVSANYTESSRYMVTLVTKYYEGSWDLSALNSDPPEVPQFLGWNLVSESEPQTTEDGADVTDGQVADSDGYNAQATSPDDAAAKFDARDPQTWQDDAGAPLAVSSGDGNSNGTTPGGGGEESDPPYPYFDENGLPRAPEGSEENKTIKIEDEISADPPPSHSWSAAACDLRLKRAPDTDTTRAISRNYLKVRTENGAQPTVTPVTLTIPAGQEVSESVTLMAKAPVGSGKSIEERLLPVELATDLNNDGQTNSSDSGLAGGAYASGASDDAKDKATEFMFANDQLSNGAWDKEDTTTPGVPGTADDDDAEEIMIKPGITEGEVWLDHPAIAGMKFYKQRKCTEEIQLSPSSHFTISSSNPFPDKVFMRAESVTFPSTDPQKEGDLKLMIKPTGGAAAGIEAAKMKFTVVEKVGATKHHRAAVDYIKENNTTHVTRFIVDSTRPNARYAVMLEAKTSLVGINAKIGDLVNIDQVIASGSWSNNTVVINCSYFGNNSSDGDFIDKHQGKLFHGGAWDQTCSIPSNWAFGVAGYAGTATAGKFEFGGEDLPNDLFYGHTQEGSGGLPNSAPGISLTWNCLAKVRLPGLVGNDQGDQNSPYEHILLSAVFGHDNGAGLAAATFDADVRKGGTHGDVFWCDGGGSYAQAIASPAGTLIKTAAAARHTWRGTLINECIKTYLGFKAKRPR